MVSEAPKFTEAQLSKYTELQKLFYSAIDDVLIRLEDNRWTVYCNTHKQLVQATVALVVNGYGVPRILDITTNLSAQYGFAVGSYFLVYRPEDSTETSKLSIQSVRQEVAGLLEKLGSFFS